MAQSMTDPRKADTLDEASRNEDGTYDGARALSWLSGMLTGGKGMTEAEVRQMFADANAQKAEDASAKDRAALR
jgi:hypothetical protein